MQAKVVRKTPSEQAQNFTHRTPYLARSRYHMTGSAKVVNPRRRSKRDRHLCRDLNFVEFVRMSYLYRVGGYF